MELAEGGAMAAKCVRKGCKNDAAKGSNYCGAHAPELYAELKEQSREVRRDPDDGPNGNPREKSRKDD
jgi:hypothetical protein